MLGGTKREELAILGVFVGVDCVDCVDCAPNGFGIAGGVKIEWPVLGAGTLVAPALKGPGVAVDREGREEKEPGVAVGMEEKEPGVTVGMEEKEPGVTVGMEEKEPGVAVGKEEKALKLARLVGPEAETGLKSESLLGCVVAGLKSESLLGCVVAGLKSESLLGCVVASLKSESLLGCGGF
jgi:hypothetical protein